MPHGGPERSRSGFAAGGGGPARLAAGLLLALVATGCAGTTHELADGFDARVPRRVAVLPFVDASAGDSFTAVPLALLLDHLPLAGDPTLEAARAATVFREKVHANLTRTALDPLPLHVVDSLLVHQGIDPVAAYAADRAEAARLLGEALAVDAVLFGEVTAWDRKYLAVEAILEAGVDVELRDTVTGAVLYRSHAHDTLASGITNVPIPIATDPIEAGVYATLEPIRGLSNTFFARLSDDVARQAIDGLAPDAAARAAAPAPTITLAACSAAAPLAAGDTLDVLVLGDPGGRATFEPGDGPPVPMVETAPGTYRGTLLVSPAHAWRDARLRVRLVSPMLRSTTLDLDRPRLSTASPRGPQ